MSNEKKRFIKEYGYQTYRRLYYLCKFFDIKVNKIVVSDKKTITILLS